MATGDNDNMLARLKAELPPWFSDTNPIVDAILSGVAAVLAIAYALYAYARGQTRILTATGIWLDLVAQDFYGTTLFRNVGELDEPFRARVIAGLFAPKGTRAAISQALFNATGFMPTIVEPFSPADCGAYGVGYAGYSAGGAYGSTLLPAQAFATVTRPLSTGIANVAGYGFPEAGYSQGSQSEYGDVSMLGGLRDAAIFAVADAARAAGVILWVRLRSGSAVPILFDGSPLVIDGSPLTI